MEITLNEHQMNEIVYKLRVALREDMKKMIAANSQPEMVTTAEAAKILRITAGRLRHIVMEDPQRYPHIKQGDGKQSRLLFERKALLS